MKIIKGDIFTRLDKLSLQQQKRICVPHVVNIHNQFGSGFAYHLSQILPEVKSKYHYLAGLHRLNPSYLYGMIQLVDCGFIVANMFAQTLGGNRPLRYNHLVKCMESVKTECLNNDWDIHTVRFGSGLAGGNQEFIECLIKDIWEQSNIYVTIYEF